MLHQFRIAVATRCLQQPLIASIKSAANMNVRGLQFDIRNEVRADELSESGRRDLLHQVREHGLSIAGATFPLNHPLYEPDKVDTRVAAIRDAMKFAYSMQAETLCIRVGQIPEDATSKSRQLLVEVLTDLARYGNHVGTILAITPTNDSAESLKALTQEVTSGPLGIDFDPAHFVMTGRSVSDSLRLLHDVVVHVQLRDGIRSIDGSQEEAVGHGIVDWLETLAVLGEIDYRGWLTSIRTQGTDRARDLLRGVKLIQQVLLGG